MACVFLLEDTPQNCSNLTCEEGIPTVCPVKPQASILPPLRKIRSLFLMSVFKKWGTQRLSGFSHTGTAQAPPSVLPSLYSKAARVEDKLAFSPNCVSPSSLPDTHSRTPYKLTYGCLGLMFLSLLEALPKQGIKQGGNSTWNLIGFPIPSFLVTFIIGKKILTFSYKAQGFPIGNTFPHLPAHLG